MKHKNEKKHDGGGLYIAICCCVLVIALIGYANNLAKKQKEEEKILTEQAGENIIAQEIETPVPTQTPTPVYKETIVTTPPASVPKTAETAAKSEEPLLCMPVGGNIICEFSADKQVYNPSLDDWRTHNGADFSASIGDSVAASADGVVSKVYMDSLGYSVRIDHSDGLSTIYSNLDENPTVALGDNVKQGDVIGHVGTSALGDMTNEAHLHFEVIRDGEYQNPADYMQ